MLLFDDDDTRNGRQQHVTQRRTKHGASTVEQRWRTTAIGSVSFVAARVIGRLSEPLSRARPVCGERPTASQLARRGVAAAAQQQRGGGRGRGVAETQSWSCSRHGAPGRYCDEETSEGASAPRGALGKRPSKCRSLEQRQRETTSVVPTTAVCWSAGPEIWPAAKRPQQ
jgi:hypothetical protein